MITQDIGSSVNFVIKLRIGDYGHCMQRHWAQPDGGSMDKRERDKRERVHFVQHDV